MTVLDHVQAVLQPILVDYAVYIIMGRMAWFFRRLPAKWRLEIESRHRDALHKALNTGVGLAIDVAQKHPSVLVADVAATRVVEYVKASVPDAIKRLGPSQQHLEDMARPSCKRNWTLWLAGIVLQRR